MPKCCKCNSASKHFSIFLGEEADTVLLSTNITEEKRASL